MRFTCCTASKRSPEEQCSTPVPHHAAGGRWSLVEAVAGRAGLDPWRTVRVGDGPSSFLGWKHWKKPDNASSITPPPEEVKGRDGIIRPLRAKCSLPNGTLPTAVPAPPPPDRFRQRQETKKRFRQRHTQERNRRRTARHHAGENARPATATPAGPLRNHTPFRLWHFR